MEISDEDKLIANGELFFSVRTYMRQKKSSDEIIAKIEEVLKQGADITACDGNDNNNTILHIAVQKEEKEVVEYILEQGATLFSGQSKQTALQLALQKNTPVGKEIAAILSAQCVSLAQNKKEDPSKQKIESKQNNQKPSVKSTVNDKEYTYSKRGGTSGVSGQFYETKLLSLVLHRALHDRDIKDFYLAANIKDIGDFDDVCFRYDNVACFMQTKHRENTDKAKLTVASVRSSTGKLGLGIYFDSFLKIRQKFSPNAADPMFQGKFEDIDCYFVLYTPLKESFDLKLSGNKPMCKKLHEIIFTCETKAIEKSKSTDMFQFKFQDYDLDFLTKFIKYEHMKTLAKTFLEFILSNNKLEAMMASDLIKLYHPALAQKVIYITKILETPKPVKNNKDPKNQANNTNNTNILNFTHVGRFRSEFFYSQDPNLNILKKTLFKEIVYTHSGKSGLTKEDLRFKIDDMARNPCPETISPLIGSPIKFDDTNDKLSLDTNKLPKNMFKHDEIQQIKFALQKITVTRVMVEHAVSLAGEKKLRNLNFPLPQSFGNIDLTTNQKTFEGIQSRLDFLAGKFKKLIDHYSETNRNKEVKVIDINSVVVGPGKILEHTHLSSNGGIGGAVGNLLEFDMQDECFIFNTKYYLSENAKYVLNKINELTGEDLSNYKINILIDNFPRVSFNVYKYDKNIAAIFLQKLWFYTNQAQEEAVEIAIKNEINIHYNADKQLNQFLFHVHSDAIFLRFHDKIQKWWKRQTDSPYITKNTNIYEKAKQDIVDSPLLTVLNVMFIRRIKTLDVEFNVNAIDNLNLDEFMKNDASKILNIISDAVVLSAAKIMQCSKYKNQTTFINLDYIHILPTNDYDTMMKELEVVKDVTLVIISETRLGKDLQDTLVNILSAFTKNCKAQLQFKRQIVIITGEPLKVEGEIIKNYDYVSLKDKNVNLIDLTSRTQSSFLQTCDIIYQGQDVKLNKIIDDNSKDLITAKLLWLLLNKEKMEIGHSLDTHKYNEIKDHYIHRDLKLNDDNCVVNTLDDLDDKVVLISSKPCMGKTILLTHLSLETKKIDPKLWIVRINLSTYDKSFEKLNKRDINKVITFLAKTALKNPDEINKVTFTAIDNETVAINSDDSENILFELQLFIHCYNSGNIIFLFDGFEKCYPQNTNEGIELFTALKQANKRIWVTGDCYVITILENIFGTSYTLECITTIQQKSFLERFWMTNLRLDKLNHDQFDNIITFFNYILRAFNHELDINEMHKRPIMPLFSVPLHVLYLTLIDHFKNEANSISPCFFRDKLKREMSLDSFTKVDHYLRKCSKDESLQLDGTPLHLYIAANYFVFQMTDKFDLHLDTKLIQERSNFYINAITLFERFLKSNMKTICEVKNKNAIGTNQEKARTEFLENHKKLALYAIYKECDIVNILSPAEIMEAKTTINLIESGELKTGLIDTVVDGVPRFYHALFAEYFLVEFLGDLLSRIKNNSIESIHPTSFWNFLVNTVLVTSPASLRNAFEYKLKYDPELAETINDEDSKKITLDLLAKPNASGSSSNSNIDNAIDIAIGEGLVNIANLLIKNAPPNIESFVERTTTVLQSSANILVAINPEQKVLSEDLLNCIKNPNAETVMQVLKSNDVGDDIHATINKKIVEPAKKLSKDILDASQNNENLVRLFNEFPKHLPDYIRQMFPKE